MCIPMHRRQDYCSLKSVLLLVTYFLKLSVPRRLICKFLDRQGLGRTAVEGVVRGYIDGHRVYSNFSRRAEYPGEQFQFPESEKERPQR